MFVLKRVSFKQTTNEAENQENGCFITYYFVCFMLNYTRIVFLTLIPTFAMLLFCGLNDKRS